MHPEQKSARLFRSAEELIEERAIGAEGLAPAMAALADGVLQVGPHAEQHFIGVEDITGHRARARPAEIDAGQRRVGVATARELLEQTQSHAAIQQSLERVRAGCEIDG